MRFHKVLIGLQKNIDHFNSFGDVLHVEIILLCICELNYGVLVQSDNCCHYGVQMSFEFCDDFCVKHSRQISANQIVGIGK